MFVSGKGGIPLYVLEYHPRSAWFLEAADPEASPTGLQMLLKAAAVSSGRLLTKSQRVSISLFREGPAFGSDFPQTGQLPIAPLQWGKILLPGNAQSRPWSVFIVTSFPVSSSLLHSGITNNPFSVSHGEKSESLGISQLVNLSLAC
jgi:hypothetical protein